MLRNGYCHILFIRFFFCCVLFCCFYFFFVKQFSFAFTSLRKRFYEIVWYPSLFLLFSSSLLLVCMPHATIDNKTSVKTLDIRQLATCSLVNKTSKDNEENWTDRNFLFVFIHNSRLLFKKNSHIHTHTHYLSLFFISI